VLRSGVEAFAVNASGAGADAVLVSDLPPDESPETWDSFTRAGLDTIVLVAPTTDEARLPAVLARASGFVYCLARTGVTGRAEGFAGALPERIAALRARTALPIGVGFGISSPEDARPIRTLADAVVVGAAFMREIAADPERGAARRTRALADALIGALR
jgi:tryptophan synthase alpha chain